MQIFYSADFPKKIVDELKNLGYSLNPFGLKEDNGLFTGSYDLKNIPKILDGKTVFLASNSNTAHGLAYSLIRHVANFEENLDVHVVDAHFDWRDKNEEKNSRIGEWGFLSHVAELPPINSIYNWGCGKRYRTNNTLRKKSGQHIDVVSSTELPDKEQISKLAKKGKIYLSVDQDVIGSESIYPMNLTGNIELKTLATDLLSFTYELKPDYMDIFLDSDDVAETMRKYVFENKLSETLDKLKMLSSDKPDKKAFNIFKNNVETRLNMYCFMKYRLNGDVPDFLSDKTSIDTYVKNTFISEYNRLTELANHAFYTDAELCRYLIEGMEGTLDTNNIDNLFMHNIGENNSKKMKEAHALTEKILKERWFGDFLPIYLSLPDILKLVNSDVTRFVEALTKKLT